MQRVASETIDRVYTRGASADRIQLHGASHYVGLSAVGDTSRTVTKWLRGLLKTAQRQSTTEIQGVGSGIDPRLLEVGVASVCAHLVAGDKDSRVSEDVVVVAPRAHREPQNRLCLVWLATLLRGLGNL